MRILFLANTDFANILGEWTFALKKYCNEEKIQNHISYIQLFNNGHYSHARGKEYNEKYKYPEIKKILCPDRSLNSKVSIVKELYAKIFHDYIMEDNIKTFIIEGYGQNSYIGWWYLTIQSLCRSWYEKDNTLKFIMFHNGTYYRMNFKTINKIDNSSYIHKVIYGSDLFRLGNINQTKKLIIIPTFYVEYKKEMITKKYEKDKLTIFHCPSRDKGSIFIEKKINDILTKYKLHDKYEFKTKSGITFNEVIELKKQTHIYIGQFCDGKHSNQLVGGFGLSSIEALATGNIVLSLNNNIPTKIIGKDFPIINLENELKFESIVSDLLLKDKKDLIKKANNSFDYFNREIGYKGVFKHFASLC
jgi:hypothetical protein